MPYYGGGRYDNLHKKILTALLIVLIIFVTIQFFNIMLPVILDVFVPLPTTEGYAAASKVNLNLMKPITAGNINLAGNGVDFMVPSREVGPAELSKRAWYGM